MALRSFMANKIQIGHPELAASKSLCSVLISDTGYPHDGRADNAAYRHDRRADKRCYRHDREIDIQMLTIFRN